MDFNNIYYLCFNYGYALGAFNGIISTVLAILISVLLLKIFCYVNDKIRQNKVLEEENDFLKNELSNL